MGGWLNHRHFLFPFINYFYGAYDAFLERMLMAVILVKDAVEQSRFAVQPASMRYGGEEELDDRGLSRLQASVVSVGWEQQLARQGAPSRLSRLDGVVVCTWVLSCRCSPGC
jgi:hypothetical protein